MENELYEEGLCIGIKILEKDRQIAFKHNEYLNKGFSDCLHLQMAKKSNAKAVSMDSHWKELGVTMGVRVCNYDDLKGIGIEI
ncbi:MAG: hypothetical protein ACOCTT_00645 [archaeon]